MGRTVELSPIKSVQRGIQAAYGEEVYNIIIAPVKMSKSVLSTSQQSGFSALGDADVASRAAILTSPTNIQVSGGGTANKDNPTLLFWELIEYV